MRALAPLPVLVVAALIGIALAYWIASTVPRDFKYFDLGEQTAPIYGSLDGKKVFCGTLEESRECLDAAQSSPLTKRVLWLGNSQLYAINQPKAGDETAPILLARALRPEGAQVTAFALSSASFSEMLLVYKWMAKEYRPDVLVIPAFLDDTREQNIRSELAPAFRRADISAMLDGNPIGAELRRRLLKPQTAGGSEEEDASMQARSENWITAKLENCCALQKVRADARGQIELQTFFFRNLLFDVTAQSVRPIIPESYRANMTALELILEEARKASTKVVVYIPPIRQDATAPYDPAQYAAFKREIQRTALAAGATFVEREKLVPARFWGTKAATRTGGDPELDFMHYQAEGHRLLAGTMADPVREALR